MNLVRKAELLVESTMTGRDGSHDASHAFRVRDMALSLASEEGLDDPSSPHFSSDGLLVVRFFVVNFFAAWLPISAFLIH